MNPTMLICFLAALVVSSAIPKSRESNEEIAEIGNKLEVDYADEDLRDQKELGDIYGYSRDHNLTLGYITLRDRLMITYNITLPAKFVRVVEHDIEFKSPYGEIIASVHAYDQHEYGNEAGFASIIDGGIGYKYVTIRLQSAPGCSLKYIVRVSGHFPY